MLKLTYGNVCTDKFVQEITDAGIKVSSFGVPSEDTCILSFTETPTDDEYDELLLRIQTVVDSHINTPLIVKTTEIEQIWDVLKYYVLPEEV